MIRAKVSFIRFVAIVSAMNAALAAQWLNHPEPGTPRTKDGKPNLSAPAPRLNGKPDLSGVWQAERTPEHEYARVLGDGFAALQIDSLDITKNLVNVFWGLKPEEEPLTFEGAAAYKHHRDNPLEFPHTQCLPGGVPADLFVAEFKVIQAPHEIVMLTGSPARQIYTDGRILPKDPEPSWMGYSVGQWQGDTLVVETIGINERAWLDAFGHPRSESMRMTERYRRHDFGHMDLEISFEDPNYYTRPFRIKTTLNLMPDSDLLEYVCAENEKDRVHFGK